MQQTNMDNSNPMLSGLKKFMGREVEVTYFATAEQMLRVSGICEGLDFGSKAVIIRNENGTILIPRYLLMARKNKYPQG